jgi:hypothetical protein
MATNPSFVYRATDEDLIAAERARLTAFEGCSEASLTAICSGEAISPRFQSSSGIAIGRWS